MKGIRAHSIISNLFCDHLLLKKFEGSLDSRIELLLNGDLIAHAEIGFWAVQQETVDGLSLQSARGQFNASSQEIGMQQVAGQPRIESLAVIVSRLRDDESVVLRIVPENGANKFLRISAHIVGRRIEQIAARA